MLLKTTAGFERLVKDPGGPNPYNHPMTVSHTDNRLASLLTINDNNVALNDYKTLSRYKQYQIKDQGAEF